MLKKAPVQITPLDTGLDTGHVPLDADVFPMDNSGTKKEQLSRTYHNYDGYAPIAAYLGLGGWCLEVELRPGSQYSQEGFVPFMKRVVERARVLARNKQLVRLDSAHDAIDTRVLLRTRKTSPTLSSGTPGGKIPLNSAEKPLLKDRLQSPVREKGLPCLPSANNRSMREIPICSPRLFG